MLGKSVRTLVGGLAATLLVTGSVQADMIVVGMNTGNIAGRDEFNITTNIPASNLNYGWSITALEATTVGTEVAIGLAYGFPDIRDAFDLATPLIASTNFTGTNASSISALTALPSGDMVIGTQDNGVFVRDRTNFLAVAPGYVGADGLNFNSPITALATTPGGDIAIGNATGEVFLRSSGSLLNNAAGATVPYVNYAIPITAMTITSDGNLVIGFNNGFVDTRSLSDMTSLSSVNFGTPITALDALSNGEVAIGLGSGGVSVRDNLDLVNGQSAFVQFTGGAAIGDLVVTSNDNIAIGTADGLFFMRGADLTTQVSGPDGINFGIPITSITAVVPEPGSVALLLIGCAAMTRRVR